jgi:Flp pilus assembly protein TadG
LLLKGEPEPAEILIVKPLSPALRDEHGFMRVMTLTKLVVFLAIVGVFGFDGFSIMSNNVSTENDAQDAAYAASQEWHTSNGNLNEAYQAAIQAVAGKGETVLTQNFTVDPDGTIHLLLRRTAHTVVFDKIGPLKHLTVTTQHGDANSVN